MNMNGNTTTNTAPSMTAPSAASCSSRIVRAATAKMISSTRPTTVVASSATRHVPITAPSAGRSAGQRHSSGASPTSASAISTTPVPLLIGVST